MLSVNAELPSRASKSVPFEDDAAGAGVAEADVILARKAHANMATTIGNLSPETFTPVAIAFFITSDKSKITCPPKNLAA